MLKMPIAINVAAGPTITLASGRIFDLLHPFDSEFEIEDIAHGLAHTCRYAGQCRGFYSVAEHSLLVSQAAPSHKWEALLHDAAEAFIGDVTRPLKQLLPEYKRIEAHIEEAIALKFGFSSDYRSAVKAADLQVLAAEQAQIMPVGTDGWAAEAGIVPANITVRLLAPDVAKAEFLQTYHALKRAA